MFKATIFAASLLATSAVCLGASAVSPTSVPDAKATTGSGASASSKSHGMPITTPNRSIYMNGVDISSARNQDLRNVHIKISDNGDLYITAPQYQVTEEETFLPLSTRVKPSLPEHKAPQSMSGQTAAKPAKSSPEKTAAANLPDAPANASAPQAAGDAPKSAGTESAPQSAPATPSAAVESQDVTKP